MVDEIVLLVCDDCNLILLGEGEGHICMHCENPLVSAKFMRQPTKHAPEAAKPCQYCKRVHDSKVACPEYAAQSAAQVM